MKFRLFRARPGEVTICGQEARTLRVNHSHGRRPWHTSGHHTHVGYAFALKPQNGDDLLSTCEDRKFVEHALYATLAAFSAASHATDLTISVGEPC